MITFKILLAAILAIAVVALVAWGEVAAWSECRQTNSVWYCMRVLSK